MAVTVRQPSLHGIAPPSRYRPIDWPWISELAGSTVDRKSALCTSCSFVLVMISCNRIYIPAFIEMVISNIVEWLLLVLELGRKINFLPRLLTSYAHFGIVSIKYMTCSSRRKYEIKYTYKNRINHTHRVTKYYINWFHNADQKEVRNEREILWNRKAYTE